MEWLTQNWFGVVIFIVFIGMHLFGHGGHGGGGGSHGPRRPQDKEPSGAERSQGHQH